MPQSKKHTTALTIAEKNPILRQALEGLFAEDERFGPVIAVTDGQEFMASLEKSIPDVGLVGWEMPGLSGREILETLALKKEAPPIVVYTGSLSVNVSHQAMAIGAAGFCFKTEEADILVDTVANVAAGRMVFPFMDPRRQVRDPFAELTDREREVLASMATGLTNAQLAGRFDISQNTVKFHVKNLFDKLGVSNRSQAVAVYLKGGSG